MGVLSYLPLIIAPFMVIVFTMVTAYVRKFNIPQSGLMQDYIVLAIIVVAALKLGGAIA